MESVWLLIYIFAIPLLTAVLAAAIMRKMILRELAEMSLGGDGRANFERKEAQLSYERADTKLEKLADEVCVGMASERDGEKLGKSVVKIKNEYALTDRETEILTELLAGNGNKAIAGKLFISENTVKTHIHNLLQKMGVANRLEALEKVRVAMADTECEKAAAEYAVYDFCGTAEVAG